MNKHQLVTARGGHTLTPQGGQGPQQNAAPGTEMYPPVPVLLAERPEEGERERRDLVDNTGSERGITIPPVPVLTR